MNFVIVLSSFNLRVYLKEKSVEFYWPAIVMFVIRDLHYITSKQTYITQYLHFSVLSCTFLVSSAKCQVYDIFFFLPYTILSTFHVSRIQHIALLCPHPLIPDLLSTYVTVSFILAWKLASSLSLFLLSLSLSLIWTDLTDYCLAGL